MAHQRPFQRLTNRSVRYGPTIIINDSESDESDEHQLPPTLLSPRLSSDESDTSSVATDFTEETVTDYGEEHPCSSRARLLRRWEAKVRVNNTINLLDNKLQHANDGIINRFRNIHRGVTAGADHLHNDVASPFYREVKLQLHVAIIMAILTIAYCVACIFDLTRWCFRVISRSIRWLWRVGVDSTVYSAVALARASTTCTNAVYDSLDTFIHWLSRDGMRLAVLFGISSMISISILKGWLGMSIHLCDNTVHNNTVLPFGQTFFQTTCELGGVTSTVQIVNSELAALLDASDAVIQTTDNLALANPVFLDVHRPAEQLSGNLFRLSRFAEGHKLVDPTIDSEDTGVVTTVDSQAQEPSTLFAQMNYHVTAIKMNADVIKHELEIRYDELNIRLNSLQEYSKKSKPHSAVGRFFSEALSFILPSAFSLTHTHRQASDYSKLARHILNDTITLSLLEKPSDIAWRIERISDLMVPARDHMLDFKDEWADRCRDWHAIWGYDVTWEVVRDRSIGKDKYGANLFKNIDALPLCQTGPDILVENVEASLAKFQAAFEPMLETATRHEDILKAFVAVHKQVQDLLDNAGGYKGAPKTKRLFSEVLNPRSTGGLNRSQHPITPMAARAILHRFVAHVGGMKIRLGRERYSTEPEIPMKNFKWYKDHEGNIRQHAVHHDFWNNVDYPGKPVPPHWTARWSERVGRMVDDYL